MEVLGFVECMGVPPLPVGKWGQWKNNSFLRTSDIGVVLVSCYILFHILVGTQDKGLMCTLVCDETKYASVGLALVISCYRSKGVQC